MKHAPITNPLTFLNDGTEWSAMRALERWVKESGYSIGPTDVTTNQRAIICEPNVLVAKWRNLTQSEKDTSDLIATGASRWGEIIVHDWRRKEMR